MTGMVRVLALTGAIWVGIAVLLALFFRYSFFPAHESTVIWRGDRMTGEIELCYSNSGRIQCEAFAPGQPYRPK